MIFFFDIDCSSPRSIEEGNREAEASLLPTKHEEDGE